MSVHELQCSFQSLPFSAWADSSSAQDQRDPQPHYPTHPYSPLAFLQEDQQPFSPLRPHCWILEYYSRVSKLPCKTPSFLWELVEVPGDLFGSTGRLWIFCEITSPYCALNIVIRLSPNPIPFPAFIQIIKYLENAHFLPNTKTRPEKELNVTQKRKMHLICHTVV